MKNLISVLSATVGVTVCGIALGTATASAQEDVGPPKPVVVVNAPANPVPVTGSITGNITGNVSITNSPTVKIDPSQNAVAVAPTSTQLLVHTGETDLGNGIHHQGTFDISKFTQIRVIFRNSNNSEGDIAFCASILLPDGIRLSLEPTSGCVTLDPGQYFNRVYDVPGRSLQMFTTTASGARSGLVTIFGR